MVPSITGVQTRENTAREISSPKKPSKAYATASVDGEYTTLQGAEGVTTAINTRAPYQGEGESAILPQKAVSATNTRFPPSGRAVE